MLLVQTFGRLKKWASRCELVDCLLADHVFASFGRTHSKGAPPMALGKEVCIVKEMVEAIRRLHAKHGFAEKGGEDMLFRMNLIMEEVGEICECLTKGYGDIAEEHADLLILLLGNCVALDIDIEKEFWRKLNKVMAADPISVHGHARVLTSARR